MPTFVNAHPWIVESVKKAGGKVIRVGSKPWAEFLGNDAEDRGKAVEKAYIEFYGHGPSFSGKPWRADQSFDYAVRLD